MPAAAESHGPSLPDNLPPGYFDPEKNTRFIDLFFDDETGDLDMSEFLALGGFIPVPIPITQPVVGGGRWAWAGRGVSEARYGRRS